MEDSRAFQTAVDLFNRQAFFECHEVLEDLWRPLAPGPDKAFLQGLIQVAVGLHHWQHRNFTGTKNKLASGLEKLSAAHLHSAYARTLDVGLFLASVQQALHRALASGLDGFQPLPPELIPVIRFKPKA